LRDEDLIDSARGVALKILDVDPEMNHLPELKSEVDKLKSDEAARFMDKS
jgi:ATP-dependent DNA helicase RecG